MSPASALERLPHVDGGVIGEQQEPAPAPYPLHQLADRTQSVSPHPYRFNSGIPAGMAIGFVREYSWYYTSFSAKQFESRRHEVLVERKRATDPLAPHDFKTYRVREREPLVGKAPQP